MTELEKLYIERLEKKIYTDGVSNQFLIELLKLCVDYLQLIRISKFSSISKKSEQSIRKYHQEKIITICDYQLIINN